MDAECKFASALTLDALSRVIPPAVIDQVVADEGVGEIRHRRLTMRVIVWLVIALHLFPTVNIAGVLAKLARGLRLLWVDPTIRLPQHSAIAYRRQHLGARPLVALFHHICQPLATPQTQGAWLFGLRAVAIDGTVEDVPTSAANSAVFGHHPSSRGASAFPQVRGVYLVECGTHAVIDAGFWPCQVSERVGGKRLLRSITRDMLVLWDRGFHDCALLLAVRQRGAHVLSRLPDGVTPQRLRALPDGSELVRLAPADYQRRKRGEHVLARLIGYTITDPALPGYGQTHRVLTTILNPRVAPAYDVACAYHERWEAEVTIDEIDTHQRLVGRPLRSLTPVGVIQELYGILLAHYTVRCVMHEAALAAAVDPDRLSFVHALEVVRDAVAEFQLVNAAEHDRLYARLLADIAATRLPARRTRTNPRVVKRKMSKFKLKRPEQTPTPRPSRPFAASVVIQWPVDVLSTAVVLPPRPWRRREAALVAGRQSEWCHI